MQHTKYKAFGYNLVKNEAQMGEIVTDNTLDHFDNIFNITRPYNPNLRAADYAPGTSLNNIWLLVSGRLSFVNLYTGNTFEWTEGYCSLDTPMPIGLWSMTHEEDTVVFTITPANNLDVVPVMPDVTTFRLSSGSSTTTNGQKRIFLCSGEVSINGVAATAGKQLVISSGKTITATVDSYGFVFN